MRLQSKWVFAAACVLALALGLLLYLPGLPGDFIFDDIPSLVNNGALRLHSFGWDDLLDAAVSSPTGALLRPISMLSFALDIHFFGIDPFWIKLNNILIHLACGAMLWFVAREVLRAFNRKGSEAFSPAESAWLSLAAALLWTVHPLNLTSVLYAVQRETALAGLFTAAALYAYLAGRRREQEQGKGGWLMWVASPLLMFLGILCKESAALLPVYLFVLEFTLLGFRGKNQTASRRVQVFLGVFLGLPALGTVALLLFHPYPLLGGYSTRDFTLYQRLLSEARILLDYLRWTFIPDIRQLALFHDDIAASRDLFHPLSTLFSVILVAGLLGLGISLRRRLPLLSFAILWFFGGHLLESTFLPLELAYEHRNYLPIFGVLLGTVGTLYLLARRGGRLKSAMALCVIALLLFGSTTALRAKEWSSELEFAKAEPRHHPDSPRALAELTWAYLKYIVTTHDKSLVPQAVAAAERSKAADRFSISQDMGLAYMYAELKDFDNARARLRQAAEDVKQAQPTATLQLALQTALVMATKENEQLNPDMERLLVNATQDVRAQGNACFYATFWNTLGIFRYRTYDVPGSLEAMNKAISICPSSSIFRENYTSMLLEYGDAEFAGKQLEVIRRMGNIHTLYALRDLEARYQALLAEKAKQAAPPRK